MATPSARLEHAGRDVKLGRIPPTPEMVARMLPFGNYVKRYGGKPPPPAVTYWKQAAKSLGEMLGNDRYGNCVIAAELHGVGVWTANEPGGREVVPTTQEAVAQYQAICGPGDNGCYIPRVLDYFRDTGLTAGGKRRKIDGYVRVNPRDQLLVKIATHLFGRLHLGINWPSDWMSAARPGSVLGPTSSNIVGGHAVTVGGYDSTGLQISTWGFICTLSWEALADPRFVDECYAPLGEDWYSDTGATAAGEGVNVTKLRQDLQIIASGGTPDIPGDDPPPPPPPPGPTALDIQLSGTVDALFGKWPVTLSGTAKGAAAKLTGVAWWAVMQSCFTLLNQIRNRDWNGATETLLQILAQLGVVIPASARPQLTARLAELGLAGVTIPAALLNSALDTAPPVG